MDDISSEVQLQITDPNAARLILNMNDEKFLRVFDSSGEELLSLSQAGIVKYSDRFTQQEFRETVISILKVIGSHGIC